MHTYLPLLERYCIAWNQTAGPIYPNNDDYSSVRCHLRAGLYPNEIFPSPIDANYRYICTTTNDIYRLIWRYLKCSINFAVAADNFGGRRLGNGSWNGILALFEEKKADFIAHSFSMSFSRDELIDFQFMLPAGEIVTMLSYPTTREGNGAGGAQHQSPLSVFHVFDGATWLAVAGLVVAFAVLNYLHRARRRKSGAFINKETSTKASDFDLKNSQQFKWCQEAAEAATAVFAVLLGQGSVSFQSNNNNNTTSSVDAGNGFRRLLTHPLYLLLFVSLLLRQLFATDILSYLLVRRRHTFDSFAQLAANEQVRILVQNTSSTYLTFRERFPHLSPRITNLSHHEKSAPSTLSRLLSGQAVLLLARDQAAAIVAHFAPTIPFHISREGLLPVFESYAVRRTLDRLKRGRLQRLFRHLLYFDLRSKFARSAVLMSNLQSALPRWQRQQQQQQPNEDLKLESTAGLKVSPALLLQMADRQSGAQFQSGSEQIRLMLAYLYIYLLGVAAALATFLAEVLLFYGGRCCYCCCWLTMTASFQ